MSRPFYFFLILPVLGYFFNSNNIILNIRINQETFNIDVNKNIKIIDLKRKIKDKIQIEFGDKIFFKNQKLDDRLQATTEEN